MLKNTIEKVFDHQFVSKINGFKQPCLRDLIFQYYIEKTSGIVAARDSTNDYISEISKQFEE